MSLVRNSKLEPKIPTAKSVPINAISGYTILRIPGVDAQDLQRFCFGLGYRFTKKKKNALGPNAL